MRARFIVMLLAASGPSLTGCSVTPEEEREIGAEDAAQIDSTLPLIHDTAITAYVTALGKSMATRTSRGDLDWRFAVVNSPKVNAFALPGGFIYVNRGTIEQAERMDELAGVVGHEIGHVVRRHSVKQLEQREGGRAALVLLCTMTRACSSLGGRMAIAVGANAAVAQYSQHDEAEADSEGVVNTVRAGIDPEGLPSFFQKMLQSQKEHPTDAEAFFATHPTDQARVDATRQQIQRLHLDPRRQLIQDTREFHDIQARLRLLPPPPKEEQNP
jgi:beta-barrel assembly-enhancing protease